jgi:pimeloyl-ACP methyl ester carboxylesterase
MHYILLLASLFSCSTVATSKVPIVFVHGAHFDARSFQELQLELSDKKSYTLNLFEKSENAKSLSLDNYGERVCRFIKKFQEKVVLLGHSQGGAVINQAYGLCPESIKSLVFVAATIPYPGEKPFDLLEARDDEYYFSAIKKNKDKGTFEITDDQQFSEGFAPDASAEQKNKILKLIRNEPVAPSKSKLKFNLEMFQMIKKFVVLTKNDRILTLETQIKYASRLQNVETFEIESGHLPMVSSVQDLALVLRTIQGDQ